MIVVCHSCRQEIAGTTPDDLSIPITGKMFCSNESAAPHPWPDSMKWDKIECHKCGECPIPGEDMVLTTGGFYQVPEKIAVIRKQGDGKKFKSLKAEKPKELKCVECGKAYKNTNHGRRYYKKHIEKCNG